MCGIVGIIGQKAVATDIVDALRRLEYRGYDSAGIATVENGHLERRRGRGQLRNLEGRLLKEPLNGHTASATRAGQRTGARPSATRIRT